MRMPLIAGLLLASMTALPAFAEPAEAPASTTTESVAAETTESPAKPNCLSETGSRIKRAAGSCNNSPGRVYHADDLRQTGQTNVGAALRNLDPSIITSGR